MLIEIDEGKIRLSTGLDESEFAKTKFSLLLSEKGLLASSEKTSEKSDENEEEPVFTFSDWTFSSIESDGLVYFTGRLPENPDSKKTELELQ